ncbi:hypothetical protein NEUTE1DRAFT_85645 [Neurospora tetrasperma FGSC 2508]|uniref:DUF676 domain-containing protein n=1 Tax=Neurospora tetrasperma (strain FGSC 2508 / ATCC MYA-4615 / P0657) TaxID=510951 RepID=F8MTQ2_NEUT8|nr:uncharacterized protein NEUTE1DRAFT_85645 [Neurospora tetrasperma FGSC 2508]EGO55384.1 hypothetical protein NEUTE1DRAFT_85645 [Neurospora tetrasperma FGSC 2508]EGZ69388.1 hypothetical protein NEUTE2DRAFT_159865 [Neurospora tetrasperma FGSC 2509]
MPTLLVLSGFTIVAIFASLAFMASKWRKAETPSPNNTKFFGSQIGEQSVINYSYTDRPLKLMAFDIYYFFKFIWALPYVLIPLSPSDSGDLDELSITRGNLFCVGLHAILVVLQLGFIVTLPTLILFPVWTAALAIGLFILVNHGLCTFLNGKEVEYHSDPKYAPALPEHAHEQWIFINGVAVGAGILFDVIECLVQRNLGYATADVRICYRIIKEKLYNPQYSKVIFILHSQGAIEGSMIIDWLLQELPQNLLAKLEVYTFGNAANHFNNPHRNIQSQRSAINNPLAASTDSTNTAAGSGNTEQAQATLSNNQCQTEISPQQRTTTTGTTPATAAAPDTASTTTTKGEESCSSSSSWVAPSIPSLTSETSAITPSAVSGRAIGHIEHYAHTTDFVALWGILHFATSIPGQHTMPRFIGRVFARTTTRGGHQLCQHYLDGMFPLEKDPKTGAFLGCAETGNEFMESEITVGEAGSEMTAAKEAMEISWLANGITNGIIVGGGEGNGDEAVGGIAVYGGHSPVEQRRRVRTRRESKPAKVKVKDLSRLWQYRNGKSPNDTPPMRTATV